MSTIERKPILHGRDHACGGADPIPGICDLTPDGGLEDEILAHPCLVALWKLDETSGDIAYDSGPDNLHLGSGSFAPPTWGQADAPPGDPSAGFDDNQGVNDVIVEGDGPVPPLTGDWSAEVWFYRNSTASGRFIAQGTGGVNNAGWMLGCNAFNEGTFNAPKLMIGESVGGPVALEANSAAAIDTWYHLAATRTSGLFRLYVNGVAQTATSSADYDPVADPGGETYIGSAGSDDFDGNLSYAALYDCALSAGEVASHYETGLLGGADPAGWVLTSDGAGGRTWAAPTIEIEF